MSNLIDPKKEFDAYYYASGCGVPYVRNEQWLNFFQGIADRIIADFQPKTVLDAGCAKGFLVEGFHNRGVDAWGIDISEYAIQEVFDTVKPYCWVGSIADPFPKKYDLIISIEVLEHMPADIGHNAIANLCAHSDRIVFSSTPFDYKETTHYNVQPPEYWAREFARHGFFRDVDSDVGFITPWAVCFQKMEKPAHQLAYNYERRYWLLWKENTDLRQLSNELRQENKNLQFEITQKTKAERLYHLLDTDPNDVESAKQEILDRLQDVDDRENQLLDELSKANVGIISLAREENKYRQRWETLEKTRTWKWLTALHKFRTKIFRK